MCQQGVTFRNLLLLSSKLSSLLLASPEPFFTDASQDRNFKLGRALSTFYMRANHHHQISEGKYDKYRSLKDKGLGREQLSPLRNLKSEN